MRSLKAFIILSALISINSCVTYSQEDKDAAFVDYTIKLMNESSSPYNFIPGIKRSYSERKHKTVLHHFDIELDLSTDLLRNLILFRVFLRNFYECKIGVYDAFHIRGYQEYNVFKSRNNQTILRLEKRQGQCSDFNFMSKHALLKEYVQLSNKVDDKKFLDQIKLPLLYRKTHLTHSAEGLELEATFNTSITNIDIETSEKVSKFLQQYQFCDEDGFFMKYNNISYHFYIYNLGGDLLLANTLSLPECKNAFKKVNKYEIEKKNKPDSM